MRANVLDSGQYWYNIGLVEGCPGRLCVYDNRTTIKCIYSWAYEGFMFVEWLILQIYKVVCAMVGEGMGFGKTNRAMGEV